MLQVIEICIFHINRNYLTQIWELGLPFHLNLSFMYFPWLWLLHINRLFSDFPPNTAFMFKHSNKRKCIIYSPNLPRLCFLRLKLNLSLQKEHLGLKCFSMWQPKRTTKWLLNKEWLWLCIKSEFTVAHSYRMEWLCIKSEFSIQLIKMDQHGHQVVK
jgi:hypothetical protein